jgi:hypothetical protein
VARNGSKPQWSGIALSDFLVSKPKAPRLVGNGPTTLGSQFYYRHLLSVHLYFIDSEQPDISDNAGYREVSGLHLRGAGPR